MYPEDPLGGPYRPAPPSAVPQSRPGDVWRGIGLTFLLHFSQIVIAIVSTGISLILIGLSQLLYIIPAIIIYSKKGRPGIVKGLIIGAAITFLLNAACFGLIFAALLSADFR